MKPHRLGRAGAETDPHNADGALTGYGGGLERKRWLLTHEGALPREVHSQAALV